MASIAIVALSRQGAILAQRLCEGLHPEPALYMDRRFAGPFEQGRELAVNVFDLPLRPLLREVWDIYDGLVLFLPVGAAVRLVAPLIHDKRSDPAVVCVDDAGRFSVSLLSGHLGGADTLAQEVAQVLGAEAVVTSGSHVTGTLAVDLLGREFGWEVEAESVTITRASAAVINGHPVGVFQGAGENAWWPATMPLPENITRYSSLGDLIESGCTAALIVSDELDPFRVCGTTAQEFRRSSHVVLYRPKTLVAGMGCRRGVPREELERLLTEAFQANNLSLSSLSCIATADLKRDEVGLLQLTEALGVPLICFGAEELNCVFGSGAGEVESPLGSVNPRVTDHPDAVPDEGPVPELHPSENARRLIGVWGVAEPAALLASGSDRLLVAKRKSASATVAVARKNF